MIFWKFKGKNKFENQFEKTKSFTLRINKGEEELLGNEKIDQADGFTYLGSIISFLEELSIVRNMWKHHSNRGELPSR